MNPKKFKLFALLMLGNLTISFAQTHQINGTTSGIEDGTVLYLRTSSPEKTLDSAMVKNGKFSLSGTTDEKIAQVCIYTKGYKNYVFFWAESNTNIHFKNGEFKKATITGSKTQAENDRHARLKAPIGLLQDSLTNQLEKATSAEDKKQLKTALAAARAKEKEIDIDFIKNHPNSILSVDLLDVYSSTWGKTAIKPLYENLNKEMQATRSGKNVKKFIDLNRTINIGDHFVDFEQMNANGKKIKLSDIKGKYILLDFWASWCGPCLAENPVLVATYNLYKDKGFTILGVSADDNKTSWLDAIKKDQLTWENVSDLQGDKNEVALIYGIVGYPTNYLIDEKGIIVAKNLRGDALKKKLEEVLK